jgi:hypothetical protein
MLLWAQWRVQECIRPRFPVNARARCVSELGAFARFYIGAPSPLTEERHPFNKMLADMRIRTRVIDGNGIHLFCG